MSPLLFSPSYEARTMQNTIAIAIALVGLVLALVGAWLTWGPWSVLVILGGAMFAFGLVSID